MTLDVHCQRIRSFVAARTIFFQRLHHDPIEITAQLRLRFSGRPAGCNAVAVSSVSGNVSSLLRADAVLFAQRAAHFIQAGLHQLALIERRPAREQFIEQHPRL